MPGIRYLGITKPTDHVRQLVRSLVFLREAEAATNVYSVNVPLITVDCLTR
jgi:hypothetical protein